MQNIPSFCTPWRSSSLPPQHEQLQVQSQRMATTPEVESLAEALNALSVKERNQINEEIHGVAGVMEETPELIQGSIQQMKDRLQVVARSKRRDLEFAIFLRPSLEYDPSLYLMFLRAKRFDINEAVLSLCAYYSNKRMLFGDELIAEKITMKHLTPLEMQFLQDSPLQILQNRESRGRTILMSNTFLWKAADWKAFGRYMWYIIVSAIEENEQLQRNGMVIIGNLHGSFATSDVLKAFGQLQNVHKHWPIHINSVHFCYDDPSLHFFLKGMHAVLPKHLRVRQRFHCGSILETKHALMTFGIDAHDCFELGIGVLSMEAITTFLQHRNVIETEHQMKAELANSGHFVAHPKSIDILMGRSSYAREWPGNMLLHRLVSATAAQYKAIDDKDRVSKSALTLKVISRMKEYGSRFLERSENGWQQSDENPVRVRVSQALRNGAKLYP